MLVGAFSSLFRARAALQLENLALRHQIVVRQRSVKNRPKLTAADRILWSWLCGIWSDWRSALVIVKPETIIAWHRKGFRLFWTWKIRHGPQFQKRSAVPGQGCAGTASGAAAGYGASRGGSASRRSAPSLRTPGRLRSAAPLSSCGTGVLRALFLAKRTSGAVRPCGHRPPGAPRNPPAPFTPPGFRRSFATKLAEPSCGRPRMGFPIGAVVAPDILNGSGAMKSCRGQKGRLCCELTSP